MTITQVSTQFGLSPDTLRYYERIGLIPPVKRNKSGIREYDESACGWVEFIKCMRGVGIPVEVLIEYVALCQQGDSTHEARKEILKEQRAQLANKIKKMQQTLERLDFKIASYENTVLKRERELNRMEDEK